MFVNRSNIKYFNFNILSKKINLKYLVKLYDSNKWYRNRRYKL